MKAKKLLISLFIMVCSLLLCSMNAFALTDGDWEFQLLDNHAMITGYTGEKGDIIVPSKLYGVDVTELENGWDKLFNGARSITFPGTIKKVDLGTSYGWPELESLVYQEGVESISGCILQEFKNLTYVSLPSTLTEIGDHAFRGTTSLTHLSIPANVKSLGWHAFNGSAIQSVDLSKSTELKLKDCVFSDCKSLTEIILPEGLKEISNGFAQNCSKLEKIDIPASVTIIGPSAFKSTSLSEIILPAGLKELHPATFKSTKLKQVVVPHGATYLGYGGGIIYGVFNDCKDLEAVYVPDTVTSMGAAIIGDCPNAIIYCSEGSFAQQHCSKNKISYLTDNSVNCGIHVYYNGKRISFHSYGQNPEILDGRTLVPLRSIFEAMGAEVSWDGEARTAIATRDGITVTVPIGSYEVYKNATAIAVDVPAQIINGRTMVPARVLAEAFGAGVTWHANGRTVLITENR